MTIPSDHLRACPEHRIVAERDAPCPCCQTGIEARPDEFMAGIEHPVKQEDLRWHIEPETMTELAPLMIEYLADMDKPAPWISVAELDEGKLPAGYTPQERWFNVLRYDAGTMSKTIMQESSARETIENLRQNGYTGTDPAPADGPNSDYAIPFDYTTAIKVRLSGLTRGSSGTGRARDTVNHLFVKEAFEEGRLSREADVYLCDPDAQPHFPAGEGEHDEPREVTCQSCLKLMERWREGGDDA